MKQIYTLLLTLCLPSFIWAQLSVQSFRALPNDLDARVHYACEDQNGEKCALIKVATTLKDLQWEGGELGVFKVEKKTGEYWLYIPNGSLKLTIKHDSLGVLRDYKYSEALREATVYEMKLVSTDKIETIVVTQKAKEQWVYVDSEPTGAKVYIDDEFAGKTPFQRYLGLGKHTYSLTKERYEVSAGAFSLNSEEAYRNTIKLRPSFSSLQLASSPEVGADVILDGQMTGKKTPCSFDGLLKGDHIISLSHEWYLDKVDTITIEPDKGIEHTVVMDPNFSNVKITTKPDAEIFVDNESRGVGKDSLRLKSGVHELKATRRKYFDENLSITVANGAQDEFLLKPFRKPFIARLSARYGRPGWLALRYEHLLWRGTNFHMGLHVELSYFDSNTTLYSSSVSDELLAIYNPLSDLDVEATDYEMDGYYYANVGLNFYFTRREIFYIGVSQGTVTIRDEVYSSRAIDYQYIQWESLLTMARIGFKYGTRFFINGELGYCYYFNREITNYNGSGDDSTNLEIPTDGIFSPLTYNVGVGFAF